MAMSERLRARIATLRVEYVKTFAGEIAGFEAELAALRTSGSPADLRERAHRIAGTSGSYALNDICCAAQALEQLCIDEADLTAVESGVLLLCDHLSEASA